jgi:protein-L-isoaspartate(D-aspartate) O-methyltransferase
MSTDLSAFHQKWRRYQGVGMTSERTRHRLIDHLVANGVVKHPQVIEILKLIPRHQFIEEAFQSRAYEDTSLPIGFGQTISQPSTVAKMTDWLMTDRQSLGKVLEIGTGSGYQSAILSLLSDKVYSIERIAGLHQRATYLLHNLELTSELIGDAAFVHMLSGVQS